MTRFKMVYYMSWLLPYLRSKTIFTLSNSFVFYWFLKCSMSHTSFSSLATCRSFCDNRSHMLLFKSKNKHIKNIPLLQMSQSSLPFHNHTIYISTIVDWYTCFMKHRCSSCSMVWEYSLPGNLTIGRLLQDCILYKKPGVTTSVKGQIIKLFRKKCTSRTQERIYHIFGQYWYTRNVPVFTNTGTFQYLGPEVSLFRQNNTKNFLFYDDSEKV